MAKAQGLSRMTVQRIWKAHRLQPHRLQAFKLSRDPQFVEKRRDVVGLCLNPPQRALVLSVDEKRMNGRERMVLDFDKGAFYLLWTIFSRVSVRHP